MEPNLNFHCVEMTGIDHLLLEDLEFAEELGYRVKLLGIAQATDDGVVQSVEPCFVPIKSPLGSINYVYNAVYVDCDSVETPFFSGLGAGRLPTASAVVGDIIDLARSNKVPVFAVPADKLRDVSHVGLEQVRSRFYLRLNVLDQPGVIADVTAILRDLGISIESMVQRGRDPGEQVHVIIKSHMAMVKDMKKAVAQIESLNCSFDKPCLIRIEDSL